MRHCSCPEECICTEFLKWWNEMHSTNLVRKAKAASSMRWSAAIPRLAITIGTYKRKDLTLARLTLRLTSAFQQCV